HRRRRGRAARPRQPRAGARGAGAGDLRLGAARGREQPRDAAHGQDPDEQGPGRRRLHQRRRGQPRRLPGDDVHARQRDAHAGRAPPAQRRPRREGQARRAPRAVLEKDPMTDSFRALQLSKTDAGQALRFVDLTEADLGEGDVVVRVEYSTVNYKDGLALTGKAPVVRVWPMIPGIDFAGVVERSEHAGVQPGDRVVLNGWGLGETQQGGYAGKARVKGDWLVKLPDGISTAEAMAIGTAGYTAMLCVMG